MVISLCKCLHAVTLPDGRRETTWGCDRTEPGLLALTNSVSRTLHCLELLGFCLYDEGNTALWELQGLKVPSRGAWLAQLVEPMTLDLGVGFESLTRTLTLTLTRTLTRT